MKDLKQQYKVAKEALETRLQEYYEAANEINAKYDEKYGAKMLIEDRIFEKVCNEHEEKRREMGIPELENAYKKAEEELLADFRNRLHNETVEIEGLNIDEVFEMALKSLKHKELLIELALRF